MDIHLINSKYTPTKPVGRKGAAHSGCDIANAVLVFKMLATGRHSCFIATDLTTPVLSLKVSDFGYIPG